MISVALGQTYTERSRRLGDLVRRGMSQSYTVPAISSLGPPLYLLLIVCLPYLKRIAKSVEGEPKKLAGARYCPFCGAEVGVAGAKFCPSCGKKLD